MVMYNCAIVYQKYVVDFIYYYFTGGLQLRESCEIVQTERLGGLLELDKMHFSFWYVGQKPTGTGMEYVSEWEWLS